MKNIIRQFIDCQKVVGIVPFGTGLINGTFRAVVLENGERKKYLLQKINHHVFRQPEAVMENIWRVAEHLSAQNYPFKILRPVSALSGKLFHLDGSGDYWRVFPFFEKTYTHEKVESPAQAHEAARAFGAFAKALDSMDAGQLNVSIPHFHDGLFRFRFFQNILAKAEPKKKEEAAEEIKMVLRSENIFQKIDGLKLPLRVVHHDTKINNLLFDEKTKKAAVVIDLDTVMPGTVLSDFGDLVRTSVSPVEEDESDLSKVIFRAEIYEAISEGFLSEMGSLLTKEERANLPLAGPWLTLMQTLRFLTDHLAGDVYYPIKYPGHNLVRTRCQMSLFHQMEKWREKGVH